MLDQGQFTLSAKSPAHLLLTMQHGNMRDFTVACGQFSASTAKG
jgi:hypothetical protein